jgi:NTE family protein
MGKIALFLAGGAPNFTLTSGALLALHQNLKVKSDGSAPKFDIVSMAGAGAVVGLLYLAPKYLTPEESLENTRNFGISDLIYSMCPINYKAFAKSGPSADLFNDYWFSLPQVRTAMNQAHMTSVEKLWSDWLLFFGSMLCPSDMNYFNAGISGHPRFIEALIDFDKVPKRKEHLEVNAFCLDDKKVVDFKKHEITVHQLRAALSFPFIYAPYVINGKQYYEGAAFQCINPSTTPPAEIEAFIILDPMSREFVQRPSNLWDAYSQSVMMPVSALAEYATETIRHEAAVPMNELRQAAEHAGVSLSADSDFMARLAQHDVKIPLKTMVHYVKDRCYTAEFASGVAPERRATVYDWSRTNLDYLFKVGYEAGRKLAHRVNDGISDHHLAQR